MFSLSTNASAGWRGWIKSYKKTVYTVGAAVGITGLVVGMRLWIQKRRLEQEKKKRIEEEKKRIEEEKKKRIEELLNTVATFKKKFLKELDSADWVGEKDVNGQKIQKVELSGDAEIVMFTDLHSCAKALKQFLAMMKHKKWTEEKNIYKLKNNNKYLAFLGDYVDRGKEGVDVIHIIFNLFINNPKKVFLLRGNHEARSCEDSTNFIFSMLDHYSIESHSILYKFWGSYGFERELDDFGIKREKKLAEGNYGSWVGNKMDRSKVKEILEKDENEYFEHLKPFNILEKLPDLLLVVHKNKDNEKRCYLLGHGAIDKDLDLKDILQKDKDIAFQKISFNSSKNIRWSGFDIYKSDLIEKSVRGIGYRMGKKVFADYCKEQSESSDVEIVGMFRGHQHHDFEDELTNSNGLYLLDEDKLWDGKTSSSFSINNIKPFVATLAPFRYSKYIVKDSWGRVYETEETHKATIVSLKLDKDFKECKITGEVMNRVQEEKKK